jgi:hypothetical protein
MIATGRMNVVTIKMTVTGRSTTRAMIVTIRNTMITIVTAVTIGADQVAKIVIVADLSTKLKINQQMIA